MKRLLTTAALAALLPQMLTAQVEKRVEVTKAYVPRVERAAKLPVEPDMSDTTYMRPDIDYTITPLSLHTPLETRPIRPATVTYWEFNRPQPFYLKVGAGYPLNSVLDLYVSTQNRSTGYVVGYANHQGQFSRIRNEFGARHNSTRMYNRIGAAAGKYFGNYVFEGGISYDNRLYHRYGTYVVPERPTSAGAAVDYGDGQAFVRFGDEFLDMSRFNFEVTLHGGLFFDHSDWPAYGHKARETTLGAGFRVGRGFGRSTLTLGAGYERLAGQKLLADQRQQLVRVGLRYGFEGGLVKLDAGADYCYDRIDGSSAGHYILPFVRLDFDLGSSGLRPFIETDGAVRPNDFRSLTRANPYVGHADYSDWRPVAGDSGAGNAGRPDWLGKSSVDYDFRLGIGGSLWRNTFNYRVYAGASVHDNRLFWTACWVDLAESGTDAFFVPRMARQTVVSFNGEVEYRPISVLKLDLDLHACLYNDETHLENNQPRFYGTFGLSYVGSKISFGVQARAQSARRWSTFCSEQLPDGSFATRSGTFRAPFGFDLRARFDWKVSGCVTLFAEGSNLAARRLYEWAWYREPGAACTAGVKLVF